MTNDEKVLFAGMRAFDSMYGRVEARLRDAAIRMLRDACESAEFMEDCKGFLLVSAAGTFDPKLQRFDEWAERTVVNACRKRRKQLDREVPFDNMDERADKRDEIAQAEARIDCESAIAKLPPMQKRCWKLRNAGYSNAEIAQMVGATHEAVRTNISRAKQTLTIALNSEY